MANYGFKVSKEGFDVKTAAIKDLIITSSANQYKIHMKGTVTFTSSFQRISVNHNLSYTPGYIAFYKSNSQSYYRWIADTTYIDGTRLSVFGLAANDIISYIIFKDIGA